VEGEAEHSERRASAIAIPDSRNGLHQLPFDAIPSHFAVKQATRLEL